MKISIHVPRVGDDLVLLCVFFILFLISIHVPRVGDDLQQSIDNSQAFAFLSTSPAWGTTGPVFATSVAMVISIHVPRVGDDR